MLDFEGGVFRLMMIVGRRCKAGDTHVRFSQLHDSTTV